MKLCEEGYKNKVNLYQKTHFHIFEDESLT